MPAHYDLILRNGICVLPWGTEAANVGVKNGRIHGIGIAADATADTVFDASGLHIMPGLIDPANLLPELRAPRCV